MKKLNKIISLLLVFSFVLGICPFVFADEAVNGIKIDGTTYFEAEDGIIYTPMAVAKDSNASGGYIVEPSVDATLGSSPQRDYAHMIYNVSVPRDDAYYVWMRVRSSGNARYYACFDDGVFKKQNNIDTLTNYTDEWVWVCDDKYWLTAGEHQYKIRYYSILMDFTLQMTRISLLKEQHHPLSRLITCIRGAKMVT